MKNYVFVIIGFNTSAYGFARSLHKTYGIIPYVFGDEKETSPIRFSTIVHCVAVQNFRDNNVFCRVLIDFVTDTTKKYILLSGSELNLYHIVLHYDELSKYYTIPYPRPLLVGSYFDKSLAMTVCQQADIAYPQSIVVSDETLDTFSLDSFTYPVILKPSVSALYKTIEFENKSKNYLICTQDQLFSTIKKIREAGYQASFLVQEIIPSSQYNEYSVNGFIDDDGHLRAISFGRALLGWPNATRRGNHLVIVNVTTDEQYILLRLTKKFFESHAYYGRFIFILNTSKVSQILMQFACVSLYLFGRFFKICIFFQNLASIILVNIVLIK